MYADATSRTSHRSVHGDNTASISLISAGVTKRSCHFSIEWFYFKELVEQKELTVTWVVTGENLADFFTKKLAREKFVYFRDKLMGSPVIKITSPPLPLPPKCLSCLLRVACCFVTSSARMEWDLVWTRARKGAAGMAPQRKVMAMRER